MDVPSTTPTRVWQLSQKLDRGFFSVPLGHVRLIPWVAFVNGTNLIIRFRKMKVSSLSRKDIMARIEKLGPIKGCLGGSIIPPKFKQLTSKTC